jgi:hypothetical protein
LSSNSAAKTARNGPTSLSYSSGVKDAYLSPLR